MDDLIIRVLSETASSFEVERLRRWREESPENDQEFRETVELWALTAPESVVPAHGPPSVASVLQEADGRPIPFPAPAHPEPRKKSWMGWGVLAASVAALALGVQIGFPPQAAPLAAYAATGEGSLTVALEDGSFVRLSPGSRLEEWEAEGTREVTLEGKAFFAVSRDEDRPFVVQTGAGEVRVLGTRFEVMEEGETLRTVVVDGRVAISNQAGSVEVGPGEAAWIEDGYAPRTETVDDVFSLLSWEDGFLVFQATPLSRVAEEVARHYGRSLTVSDGDLGGRRVTAWFLGEAFEEVAQSLCLTTAAVCTVTDDGITISTGDESGGAG